MIWECLEDSIQSGKEKASLYASVNKEWHTYFEPYIFRRLTLSSQRLNDFEAMISGHRRSFVQHIWFRFERSIQPGVTPIKFRHEVDCLRFASGILHLFEILSEWPERGGGQPGIALELTAFSAVDPEYSMKDTIPEELKDVDLTLDSETLNAIYDKTPSAMRRLTDDERRQQIEILEFYLPQTLMPLVPFPKVKLITDLTVRRQMHISFFTPHIKRFIGALPNLEFLTYEPRQLAVSYPNAETVRNIITAMPSSIRRLQVFEDRAGLYDDDRWAMPANNDDGSLGRLVADLSQEKEPEAIAMSFIIDAVHFFSDFWTPQISRPHWKLGWLNLTCLVLTSSVISPHSCDRIPPLLIAAARAALHMPKLEVMELYYVMKNHGGIFTYIHDKEGSIMCWESTWKWEFPPQVKSVWRQAAHVHGAKAFEHDEGLITVDGMGWGSTIVSMLRTRATVVHPLTYGNMINGLNYV